MFKEQRHQVCIWESDRFDRIEKRQEALFDQIDGRILWGNHATERRGDEEPRRYRR